MNALETALRQRIAERGPITVAEYMAACLHDPTHGYYRRGDPLGASGDFTTAPEISQMFGELLGLWSAEAWQMLGAPTPVRLIELGPGRGTLMADALRAVKQALPAFAAAIDLHLVEISPGLRGRQQQALADTKVTWHERGDTLPAGPAIILANEFLDALPIRQIVRADDGWHERMVGLVDDKLAFVTGPPIEAPAAPVHRDAPTGAIVEIGSVAQSVVAALAARIAASGGATLLIDYGPAESAPGDSLQALQRHKPVDPLESPGESDLTAHVDFAALAQVARAQGAKVFGPVAQGVFLNRLGIVARAAMLTRRATPTQARDIEAACRRLIGDSEMGTLFKVLAIAGPDAPALPGFDP